MWRRWKLVRRRDAQPGAVWLTRASSAAQSPRAKYHYGKRCIFFFLEKKTFLANAGQVIERSRSHIYKQLHLLTADKHILQLYLYPVIQVLAVKNRERKMSHECSPLPPSSPLSVRRQRQSFSFLTTCSTILKPEPLCVSLLTVAGQPPG
jgi:hypothetical protein